MGLNAVEGKIRSVDITCTDHGAGWVIQTGLMTDFVCIDDLNAAWMIIYDANITYTGLRAGWVIYRGDRLCWCWWSTTVVGTWAPCLRSCSIPDLLPCFY